MPLNCQFGVISRIPDTLPPISSTHTIHLVFSVMPGRILALCDAPVLWTFVFPRAEVFTFRSVAI